MSLYGSVQCSICWSTFFTLIFMGTATQGRFHLHGNMLVKQSLQTHIKVYIMGMIEVGTCIYVYSIYYSY